MGTNKGYRMTHAIKIIMVVLLASISSGQAEVEERNLPSMGSLEQGEAHDDAMHWHKNHLSLFLGLTQAEEHGGERDDPRFTVGIDYERRLTDLFGAGLLFDAVIKGNREFLVGIPVFLHPWKGAKICVAPGWHKVKEDGGNGAVLRLGVGWDFDIGKASLTPSVMYDITEHENLWLLGLAVGKAW